LIASTPNLSTPTRSPVTFKPASASSRPPALICLIRAFSAAPAGALAPGNIDGSATFGIALFASGDSESKSNQR